MLEKPNCFVICPLDEPNSEIRRRSDQVLKHIIIPAAKDFDVIRADQISEPGDITTQVIQHLQSDQIVVADLTGHNANVFYELAVRHLLKLPFAQIIQKGEKPPFDTVGLRTIPYDLRDPDSVQEAKIALCEQIEYTTKNPERVTSPMSIAVDMAALSRSPDPGKRELADLRNAFNEFGHELSNISEIQTTQVVLVHELISTVNQLKNLLIPPEARSTPRGRLSGRGINSLSSNLNANLYDGSFTSGLPRNEDGEVGD